MPRVYLSDADRSAARELQRLDKLSELVRTCKGRTARLDEESARAAGISKGTFTRAKRAESVGQLSFRSALRLAHAVGCTAEDWLKIGGFK